MNEAVGSITFHFRQSQQIKKSRVNMQASPLTLVGRYNDGH